MTMVLPPFLVQIIARYTALPRQQQLGILFGVPLVIGGTFGYLAYGVLGELGPDPMVPESLRRPGGVYATISGIDEQIAEKQKIIDEMPVIRKKITDLQEDIDKAEERLPREAEKASMREVFERLARDIPIDVGVVRVKSMRITEGGPGAAKSDYSTVTYSADLLGDMNGLISYIDAIEKYPRFMTVNQLTLRAGEVAFDPKTSKLKFGLHSVKVEIMTYIYNGAGKKGAKP